MESSSKIVFFMLKEPCTNLVELRGDFAANDSYHDSTVVQWWWSIRVCVALSLVLYWRWTGALFVV